MKLYMACPITQGGHKLECGPIPNRMAAQSNIGVALCESSVIPFLVPCRRFWLTPAAGVPCSNAANIGEGKTWTNLHLVKFHQRARPQKCIQCTSPGDGQTLCKVRLAYSEWCCCSNEAKTRKPLKFPGVPQNYQQISAVNGPTFAILWGHLKEILLFNKFFFLLSIHALVEKTAQQSCAMVCRWRFFVIFASCISYELCAAGWPAF